MYEPNTINKVQLEEILTDRYYRRAKTETKPAYARRVASIMFRGWSFLGTSIETHEARIREIEALLPN